MEEEELRDQRSQMVVKSNEIIQRAKFKLTATQQKFICYLVSMIKPTDKTFQEYTIRVEDFCELTGIDKNHFYEEFIDMIDDLDVNKSFWVDTEKSLFKFRWFDDTEYVKGQGEIKVVMSIRMKDYLLELRQDFTQYELYNILGLKSKYSIRLYELFKSYEFQQEKIFKTEELKELLCAESYTNFRNFRVRVLEPAIAEINKYTDLETSFEPIRRGKRMALVKFIINRKGSSDRYRSYKKTVEKIEAGRG